MNKSDWRNDQLYNAFGLFTIPSAFAEFSQIEGKSIKDDMFHWALGVSKLFPVLGFATYQLQKVVVLLSISSNSTTTKIDRLSKEIINPIQDNTEKQEIEVISEEVLERQKLEKLRAEEQAIAQLAKLNKIDENYKKLWSSPLASKDSTQEPSKIEVNITEQIVEKPIENTNKDIYLLEQLLDVNKTDQWKAIIKDNRKEFGTFIKESVIDLLDKDFKVGPALYGEVILKRVYDLIGGKEFEPFMREIVPSYPMYKGASEFVGYEKDQVPFMQFAYFFAMAYVIDRPNRWMDPETFRNDNGMGATIMMKHILSSTKTTNDQRYKAALKTVGSLLGTDERFHNSLLNKSASQDFVEKLFACPKEDYEKWEEGAEKGLLNPFCQALLSRLNDSSDIQWLGGHSVQDTLQQIETIIGKDLFLKVLKESMPEEKKYHQYGEWRSEGWQGYPHLSDKSAFGETLFNFLMDRDEETWKVELAQFKDNTGPLTPTQRNRVLTYLANKDPDEYNKALENFILTAMQPGFKPDVTQHTLLFSRLLDRMRGDKDLTMDILVEFFNLFDPDRKGFPKDFIEKVFPSYPFIPPLSKDDTSQALLFRICVEREPRFTSFMDEEKSGFGAKYGIWKMREAFYKLDRLGMNATFKLLQEEKYKHILETLLHGKYYNETSIIFEQSTQWDKTKHNYADLLDALHHQCPEELKELGKDESILAIIAKDKDPELAKELFTTYAGYFPMIQGIWDQPEDQPADTLSMREKLLALTGGDEKRLEKLDWELIELAIQASKIDSKAFYSKHLLTMEQLTTLWEKQPELTKKILSQSLQATSRLSIFGEFFLKDNDGTREFLKKVWASDKSFFKEQCVGKQAKISLVKFDFEQEESQLLKICSPDEIREIIEFGRGKFDADELAKELLSGGSSKDHYPIKRFLACMKSNRLPLDGFAGFKIPKLLPNFPLLDEVKEVSIVGCKLNYHYTKQLFQQLKNLDTITIQSSDLPNLESTLKHLFLDLKEGQLRPFTIRFADITPIELPTEMSELENERYASVFKRVGIPDNERLKVTPQSQLAFTGRLEVTKENLKQVKAWLFSKPFTSLSGDLQNTGKTLYECREIIKNRNDYIENMLKFGTNIREREKSLNINFDKIFGDKMTPAIEQCLLRYFIEGSLTKVADETDSDPLNQEELKTLVNIAAYMMDPQLDRLVHHYAFENEIAID